MSVQVVIMMGNIGSGKTSLIQKLVDIKGVHFETEPWVDETILREFIEDPRSNAYRFQMRILDHYQSMEERYRTLKNECERTGERAYLVMERCPVDCMRVFIPLNKENMSPSEYEECMSRCNIIMEGDHWRKAIRVKLSVTPRTCYDRIIVRQRMNEGSYTKSYIEDIGACYEIMEADHVLINEDVKDQKRNVEYILSIIDCM